MSFPCPRCSMTFSFATNRTRHLKQQHPSATALSTSSDQPKYECHFCQLSLLNHDDLTRHIGETHSSSSSAPAVSSPVNLTAVDDDIMLLRQCHSKTTSSAKSLDTLAGDARFILSLAKSKQLVSKSLIASLFTECKLEQVISLLETDYSTKSARGYALLLALSKMFEYFSSQPSCILTEAEISKSNRLLERARLPMAKMRKRKTLVSHNEKNLSTSDKWLTHDDMSALAKTITQQLNELDSSASASLQHARRFHDLLLLAFHVLGVPQRSQAYKQLQLGHTLFCIEHEEKTHDQVDGHGGFTVGGSNPLPAPAAQSLAWRMVYKPTTTSASTGSSSAVSWKTTKPLDYALPVSLNRWLTSWLHRWRPLICSDDKDYVFLAADGSGPVTSIRTPIVALVRELTGQRTPPHLFRSICATNIYNSTGGNQDVLQALADTMATSIEVLKTHYIIVDRLAASAKAQAVLDNLLAVPVNAPSDSTSAFASHGAIQLNTARLSTAKLKFNQRVQRETRAQRPVDGKGKRARLPWTISEEAALMKGIEKCGEGQWAAILADSDFGAILAQRSNVDLKDKWRSMSSLKRPKKQLVAESQQEQNDSEDEDML